MHVICLAAFSLLVTGAGPGDINRDALRSQAVMPSFDLQLGFSTMASMRVLRLRRIVELEAIGKPTAHELYEEAEQRELLLAGATNSDRAQPDYLRAIAALKTEADKDTRSESELALAYQAIGHEADALKTAQHLLDSHPDLWLSYSTLGAVKAKQVQFDPLLGIFQLIQGDESNEEKLKKLRADAKAVDQIQKVSAALREARQLLDKGIALAPDNPVAYRLGSTVAIPQMIAGPLELLIDGKYNDTASFSDMMASPFMAGLDLKRQAALLSNDVQDSVDYLGAVFMAYTLLSSAQEPDELVPGLAMDLPRILDDSMRAKVLPVFNRALKLSGTLAPDVQAAILRDLATLVLLVDDPARAPKLAEQAAKLTPKVEQSARLHVDLLMLTKKYGDAAKAAESYGVAHPDWIEIRYRGAKAYEADSKLPEALRVIKKLRAANPKDMRFALAEVAFRLRSRDDAKAPADSLAMLKSMEPALSPYLKRTAGLLRAIALGILGKRDEAKKILERIDVTGDPKLGERVAGAVRALG